MDSTNRVAAPSPSFYELSFASQMIVWAMRKRLHLHAGGPDDSHVADVFALASLDEIYEALTSIVDVLACGPSHRIQLHAVSCPCLAPHEIGLVNALAHLQGEEHELAYGCVSAVIGRAAACLVWPAIGAIARDLDERALRVMRIDAVPAASSRPPHLALH